MHGRSDANALESSFFRSTLNQLEQRGVHLYIVASLQ